MFCFICGAEVTCPKENEHAAVHKACGEKKGAIWVHVVDDLWNNVEDASITVDGEDKTPTGTNGFAKFDPMDAGKHTAKLALEDTLPKKYDPPALVETETTLSNGQVTYLAFQLVRRAKLKVHVHLKDTPLQGFKAADVTITPKKKGDPAKKPTAGEEAIADFEDRSADDYEVAAVLSEPDQKTHYSPEQPLPFSLLPGEDKTVHYPVSPLARPKILVVEKKSRAVVKDVGVKLEKGGDEHDFGKTADVTGLAELAVDKKGLRGAEYNVLLTFDEKVHMKAEASPKVTFADGSTETKTVELVKLARPKLRVVEKATGKEVEGIVVSLTATKDAKKTDLDPTRNSGFTEIAKDKPGLAPDKYTIAVAADSYKPVLDSPADVTFVEDDTQTVIVKVTTPKGAIRFLINRYDAKDMGGRVTFTLAKTSDTATILHTVTTAAREREEQREGDRKVNVKEDWKEVGDLDADTYELVIDKLKADVLDKQELGQTWRIGPNETGKVKVKVEAGKTAEVRFTVHRYKKARFIGFNVMPGYVKGERCPTCFKQYATGATNCGGPTCGGAALVALTCPTCAKVYPAGTTHCSASTCGGTPLKGKRCFQCHTLYTSATADCAVCAVISNYRGPGFRCATCNWLSPTDVICGNGHLPPHAPTHVYQCWKVGCQKLHWSNVNAATPCPFGCKLPLNDEQIYLGLPDNQEDLLARCLVVKAAIKEAFIKEADDKEEELKIFMGPEFYFRGKDGTYKAEDLHLIMDALREETKLGKYKDWLFIHGTAIGHLPQAPSADTQYTLQVAGDKVGATVIRVTHGPHGKDKVDACGKVPQENGTLPAIAQWKLDLGGQKIIAAISRVDADHYDITLPLAVTVTDKDPCTLVEPSANEILNYALVQRGGPDNVAGLREDIVYKEKVSHIDFLRHKTNNWTTAGGRNIFLDGKETLALTTEGGDDLLARKKNPISGEQTKSGLGGGTVFMMDGITFGLEVCLDHAKDRLKNYYATNPTGVGKVQIHLIPSWGMSITKTALAGMVNTLIFNVDGPEGSDAAKQISAIDCTQLALPVSHPVAQPAAENVTFKDSSARPPADKTLNNLDPDYKLLVPKHKHRVNRGAYGAEDYVWVDLYAAEDIPPAESV